MINRLKLDKLNKKHLVIAGILILLFTLPVTLILVRQIQDTRSSAATPDQLETEAGVLSSSGVSKQADSEASGDQYVKFEKNVTGPTPTPASGPTPIGNTYNIPSGIDRTGTTNVSSQIQSFIDNVPNGNTIVFPSGATYLMGGDGIKVDNKNNLYFQGSGAKIKTVGCVNADSNFLIGKFGESSNITLNNLILEGSNPTAGSNGAYNSCGEHAHGISIFAGKNIYISNIHVTDVYGDCLYTSEKDFGSGFIFPESITFTDSICERNGRMGIAIVGGRKIKIQNSDFDKISLYAFDIEANRVEARVEDIEIIDNTVGSYGIDDLLSKVFFSTNGYDDGAAIVNNIIIARNYITGGPIIVKSTEGPNRTNIKIMDNTSTVRVTGPVMDFRNNHGVTVTGNKQPLSSGSLASFSSCTNVTYSNNNTN